MTKWWNRTRVALAAVALTFGSYVAYAGLETGTFVDDLVTTNPDGADPQSQGDEHLRLIKTVLKNTFPDASRAFQFETAATKTGAYPVVAADDRSLIVGNATTAPFTITLPLSSTVYTGFYVTVVKSDATANAVTLDGNGAETINGAATYALSTQYQAVTVMWDGGEWKITQTADPNAPSAFVNVIGDTMTGNLTIDKSNPSLILTSDGGTHIFQMRVSDSAQRLQIETDTAAGWGDIIFQDRLGGDLENLLVRRSGGIQQIYARDDIASQAEAQAGTDNDKVMTPLRVSNFAVDKTGDTMTGLLTVNRTGNVTYFEAQQASVAKLRILQTAADNYAIRTPTLTLEGLAGADITNLFVRKGAVQQNIYSYFDRATQAEAEAGTNTTQVMTPLRTAQAIDAQAVNVVGDTMTGNLTVQKADAKVNVSDGTHIGVFRMNDSATRLTVESDSAAGWRNITFQTRAATDLDTFQVRRGGGLQSIYARDDIATQGQAEAGTDNDAVMTALRVAQAIDALSVTQGTAQATTSGTSKTFSALPASMSEIVFMLSGVSTNGTSELTIRIGDSGGIENTGYNAGAFDGTSDTFETTGFQITISHAAADTWYGRFVLTKLDGNEWAASCTFHDTNNQNVFCSGTKTLSAVMDRIQITTENGTDAFDAGKVNVQLR